MSDACLTEPQKGKLLQLLDNYRDVFAFKQSELGRTSLITHHIEIQDPSPVKARPYRTSHKNREVIRQHIEDMLEHDVIEPSNSPWAGPVVLVPKKDGLQRFCVDLINVNAVTRKDSYALPHINDTVDCFSETSFFSTLNLRIGYWQIGLDEVSHPLTAFTTYQGLYQFKVLPFGLTNAPATFQRLMEVLLRGLQWNICLCYIDDIILFSKTFDDHLAHLREIFDRFRDANIKLKPQKCTFAKDSVKFLGHIVSTDGIRPDPDKIEIVKSYPVPTSSKKIKQLLGLVSYYRCFIQDFSSIASPLYKLLKKNVKFQWSDECQMAFKFLIDCLISHPILAYPDFTLSFQLYVDPSGTAIGMTLGQKQNGADKVIAYAGRSLKSAETIIPLRKRRHSRRYTILSQLSLLKLFCSLHRSSFPKMVA